MIFKELNLNLTPSEDELPMVDSNNNNQNDSHNFHHPDLYSLPDWEEKVKDHPWLISRNGKIGCKICKEIKDFCS